MKYFLMFFLFNEDEAFRTVEFKDYADAKKSLENVSCYDFRMDKRDQSLKRYGKYLEGITIVDCEIESCDDDYNPVDLDCYPNIRKRISFIENGELAPTYDDWALDPNNKDDIKEYDEIFEEWKEEMISFRNEFAIDEDNIDLERSGK